MRTKASVHTLSGHTNAVATVKCQAAEPQVVTGKVDMVLQISCLINPILAVFVMYFCEVQAFSLCSFITFIFN